MEVPNLSTSNDARPDAGEELRLWLCPHVSNTIEQARKLSLYRPPDAQQFYCELIRPCTEPDCYWNIISRVRHMSLEPSAIMLRTSFRLFEVEDCEDPVKAAKQHFTTGRIKLALSYFDLPICKHLRLSDPVVGNHFNPKCLMIDRLDGTYAECSCSEVDLRQRPTGAHFRPCLECFSQGCFTTFGFQSRHELLGGKRTLNLKLYVFRDLGGLENSSHPAWTCHAMSTSQLAQFSSNWRVWMTFIEERRPEWNVNPVTSSTRCRNLIKRLLNRVIGRETSSS